MTSSSRSAEAVDVVLFRSTRRPARRRRVAARSLLAGAVVAAAAMGVTASHAQSPPAPALDRDAVGAIVREYLLAHPEVIEEAVQVLRARREREQLRRARAAIARHAGALLAHPMSPVSGAADGDVTVVEFFDYQCGYCKRVLGPMLELLDTDARVRVVWKEFPVLGPVSRFAARAAMAAARQGRYQAFHVSLMGVRERLSEPAVIETAAAVGLDVERLRRDMDDPAIDAYLEETAQLAAALGIGGTPAFVIGDTLIPGAVDGARLEAIVAQARSGG